MENEVINKDGMEKEPEIEVIREDNSNGSATVSVLVFLLKLSIMVVLVLGLVIFYPVLRSEFLNLAGIEENIPVTVSGGNQVTYDEGYFADTTAEILKINDAYNQLANDFETQSEAMAELETRITTLENEKKSLIEFMQENWEIREEEEEEDSGPTLLELNQGSSLEQFIQQ